MSEALNTVHGDRELCGWQVAEQVCWVQTRLPAHARKLSQRQDSRLVMRGVHGGYLRTFEFEGKTFSWVKRLIARYTGNETATGGPLSEPQ